MPERKAISKKLRMEVFKRDSFTCQYCGRMAPDVILEIDHINAVKNGGQGNILNLVTACFDCNRGKGARELSENQTLKMQQEQLKELSERREQMKMMVEWKESLCNLEDEQVDVIDSILGSRCNTELTEFGRNGIKKHIKKYGLSEMIEATNISISQYYRESDRDTVNKVISYIPRICFNRAEQAKNPYHWKANYVAGILERNRMLYNKNKVIDAMRAIIKDDNSCETATKCATTARNWTDFWDKINENFGGGW